MLKLAVYYVATFIFTVLLGGLQEAAGASPEMLILPQLAPGIAGVSVSLFFYRRFRSFEDSSFSVKQLLAALILPLAASLIIYILLRLSGQEALVGRPAAPTLFLLLWMPVGAAGEEIGWKGFMDRELELRFTLAFRALIGGTLWACWHVGMYSNGLLYFIFFLILMISYRYILGVLTLKGMPLVAAVLFHWAINLGNIFLIPVINSTVYIIPTAVLWAATAGVFYIIHRRGERI